MTQIIVNVPDDATPRELLTAILAALPDPNAPPELPPRITPTLVVHKGVHFLLYAPVADDWEPSTAARTFGVNPNWVAGDPSMPKGARSPSGYPVYSGRIQFADESFADEAALAAWRAAVAGQGNQGGQDATQQAILQAGQVDVKAISREQLEGLLVALGRNEVGLSAKYGPTKLLHELSQLMHAGGIHDDGTGHIVPPPSWPELSDMTVERAKQLAGLA